MTKITLRTLLRDPLSVKRLTRLGHKIQVTDRGELLWMLQGVPNLSDDEPGRQSAIDEILEEVLLEKPSKISAVGVLEESRR
jgi:hypothetical protein